MARMDIAVPQKLPKLAPQALMLVRSFNEEVHERAVNFHSARGRQ